MKTLVEKLFEIMEKFVVFISLIIAATLGRCILAKDFRMAKKSQDFLYIVIVFYMIKSIAIFFNSIKCLFFTFIIICS